MDVPRTGTYDAQRRRPVPAAAALLLVVIALGLASRRFGAHLPSFIAAYAGDTLWAAAAFLVMAMSFRRLSTARLAVLTLLIAVLVELSQLYHAPWIDAVRATTPGHLLLGDRFVWSDLPCYAAGALLGAALDRLFLLPRREPENA